MAIQSGLQVGRRCVQADQVEGIGGLAAELERESFETEVAEHPQVDIAISRRAQIVARRVAVGSARSDAACHARAVLSKSCRIEPRFRRDRPGSVRIEECAHSRNQVRAICVSAVEVVIGAAHDRERRSALKGDDGRDRPAIEDLPHERVGTCVVVKVPQAGDACHMPAVIVSRASFLPQIVEVLSDCLTDRRLIDALEGMAEDVETVDHQIVGKRPAGRNLKGVV